MIFPFATLIHSKISLSIIGKELFLENKIDSKNQEQKTNGMIQTKRFRFEKQDRETSKNDQGNDLLNDFELPKVEWTAIFRKSNTIRRNLKTVFKKCDSPTNQYDRWKSETSKPVHLIEFQMPIPSERHKNV